MAGLKHDARGGVDPGNRIDVSKKTLISVLPDLHTQLPGLCSNENTATRDSGLVGAGEGLRERLSREEAARYLTARGLKIAKSSLAAAAVAGWGPPYAIWGNRASYAVEDLDTWASERLGRTIRSTAERNP